MVLGALALRYSRARAAGNRCEIVQDARVFFPSRALPALALLAGVAGTACSSKTPVLDLSDGGYVDEPTYIEASCLVALDSPPLLPAIHVAIGTEVEWDSNPPSSGPHFPIWAAYQAYTSPVPRGYYVHDLEHGAVVFLYNCPNGCPDVVATLQAASDAIPDDPLCTQAGEGVRVRTVITPDPLLDVPVAAAAWGYTYKAACADLPTLTAFARAHYGNGPEVLCTNGTTSF
jgi:hypothetical protein